MDNSKELKDRERIAKQIAKGNDLIHKKYRILKTGKIDKDIALEKHFMPIVEPLKQIVENTANESQPIKKKVNVVKDKNFKKRKLEDNEDVHDDKDDSDDKDDDNFWMDNSWLQLTLSSKKQRIKDRTLRRIPNMRRLNHANYRTKSIFARSLSRRRL